MAKQVNVYVKNVIERKYDILDNIGWQRRAL
jgi:hypothetical protein